MMGSMRVQLAVVGALREAERSLKVAADMAQVQPDGATLACFESDLIGGIAQTVGGLAEMWAVGLLPDDEARPDV